MNFCKDRSEFDEYLMISGTDLTNELSSDEYNLGVASKLSSLHHSVLNSNSSSSSLSSSFSSSVTVSSDGARHERMFDQFLERIQPRTVLLLDDFPPSPHFQALVIKLCRRSDKCIRIIVTSRESIKFDEELVKIHIQR
jgi:hypothetical protein